MGAIEEKRDRSKERNHKDGKEVAAGGGEVKRPADSKRVGIVDICDKNWIETSRMLRILFRKLPS